MVNQMSLVFFIQQDTAKSLVAEPWVFIGRSGLAWAERLTRANLMHFILEEGASNLDLTQIPAVAYCQGLPQEMISQRV
jgi:hypothetical protein